MKKFRGAVAVAAAFMATSSFSQDRRLVEAFHCPDIDNDIARLECFDSAYRDYLEAANAPGKWIIESSTNPLDDSITTLIGLNAKEGASGLSGPHQMVIRCAGSNLSAWIKWQRVYGIDSNTVTSRVGKGTAKTEEWLPGESGSTTFYPGDTRQFVLDLMAAGKFAAQMELDDGQKKLATFNVRGLEQATTPIKQACLPRIPTAQEELIEALKNIKKRESP